MKAEILKILKKEKDYVSGQELCESLGVSRTAVWKAIRQLEEQGYVIEAVRNKGYRLVEEADVLTFPSWNRYLYEFRPASYIYPIPGVYADAGSGNGSGKRGTESHGLKCHDQMA